MSLLDTLRRRVAEDALNRVTDARPLFAAAGAADYAFEFVRLVPDRLEKVADTVREEWTAERFGDAFGELVDGANVEDLRARAEHVRDQLASTLRDRRDSVVDDLADLSADARDLPTQLRARARQAPGRAVVELANQVGAAYEAYDSCVDRGRVVLARLRGDAPPGRTPSPENRMPVADPVTPITPVTRPRPPVPPSSVESTPPIRRAAPAGAATTGAPDPASPVKRAAVKRAAVKRAAAEAGTAGTGTPKAGTAGTGGAGTGTAGTGTAGTGGASIGTAKTSAGTARTRTARTGTARTSTARTSTARTGTAPGADAAVPGAPAAKRAAGRAARRVDGPRPGTPPTS